MFKYDTGTGRHTLSAPTDLTLEAAGAVDVQAGTAPVTLSSGGGQLQVTSLPKLAGDEVRIDGTGEQGTDIAMFRRSGTDRLRVFYDPAHDEGDAAVINALSNDLVVGADHSGGGGNFGSLSLLGQPIVLRNHLNNSDFLKFKQGPTERGRVMYRTGTTQEIEIASEAAVALRCKNGTLDYVALGFDAAGVRKDVLRVPAPTAPTQTRVEMLDGAGNPTIQHYTEAGTNAVGVFGVGAQTRGMVRLNQRPAVSPEPGLLHMETEIVGTQGYLTCWDDGTGKVELWLTNFDPAGTKPTAGPGTRLLGTTA